MPPSLLAFAEVSFCVEDVDEEVAPEEDALAVGLTTIRGVWVLVDDVMAEVDEGTTADELGWALLDAGFFDVEVDAAFLVVEVGFLVVDAGFLVVDAGFLVVVSSFSNFWANNNKHKQWKSIFDPICLNKLYIQLFYSCPRRMESLLLNQLHRAQS